MRKLRLAMAALAFALSAFGLSPASAGLELGADCTPGNVSDSNPSSKACYTFTGGCTIVEESTTTTTRQGTGFFLRLFWVYDSGSTSTKIVSTVDCSGSVSYTIAHWGGIGPRSATSKMLLSGAQSGVSTEWLGNAAFDLPVDDIAERLAVRCDNKGSCAQEAATGNANKEVETCEYLGGLGFCSTSHQGNWGAHFETQGTVANLRFCGSIETYNELGVPISGLLSGGDTHVPCWTPTVQRVRADAVH